MSEDRDKIRKVLAMLEGAKTEGEAQAASLALQRLLAKTGLTVEEVDAGPSAVKEYGVEISGAATSSWKLDLAVVIAENYRCASFVRMKDGGGRIVGFIGQGDDSLVAAECFIATCAAAERCFRRRCREIRKSHQDIDPTAPLARRGYYYGFVGGLMQAYEDQLAEDEALALAIRMPKSVQEAYEAHKLRQAKPRKATIWEPTYKIGHEDGYSYGKTAE